MHRGEWIKKKIKDQGYSLDILSEDLQVARTTLWRMTRDEDLPFFKMKMLADAIGITIVNDFPEAAPLYEKREKDYRALYQHSLEEIAELREELEKYKVSGTDNRDSNGTASK